MTLSDGGAVEKSEFWRKLDRGQEEADNGQREAWAWFAQHQVPVQFFPFKSWKWIKIVFQAFCQRSDKYNGYWLWWRRGGLQVGQPTSRSTWIRNACQGEIRACDGRPRLREETSARAAWGGPRADHGPQEAAGEEGEGYKDFDYTKMAAIIIDGPCDWMDLVCYPWNKRTTTT